MKKSWEEVYAGFKRSDLEEKVERYNNGIERRRFEYNDYKYDFFFIKNKLRKIEAYSPKCGLTEIHNK